MIEHNTDKESRKITKLFFDLEFTGLTQFTEIISIGIVSDDGQEFYAELNDYAQDQVNDWINRNVISNLIMCESDRICMQELRARLLNWICGFERVEMWGDCLAYDWVLFCEIFGGATRIPKNIYYIPFDICTLMKNNGIDPDISREELARINLDTNVTTKHNALHDAMITRDCYNRILEIGILDV